MASEFTKASKGIRDQCLLGRGRLECIFAVDVTGVPDRVPASIVSVNLEEAARSIMNEASTVDLAEAWRRRHLGLPKRSCYQRGVLL